MPTTYYIDADSGDDTTGDGSSGTPWETITKAFTAISTSDTIYVNPATATYAWNTSSKDIPSGVTIEGLTDPDNGVLPENIVFDGGGSTVGRWQANNDVGFTVKNLTFQNATPIDDKGLFSYLNSTTFTNCTITIENCNFRGLELNVGGGASGGLFSGRQWAVGTYNITSCRVYECQKQAAVGNANFASFRDGTVEFNLTNCTIHSEATGSGLMTSFFSGYGGTVTGTFQNTQFYNGTDTAVSLAASSVWSGITMNNCNYYSSGSGSFTNVPSGSDNFSEDPQFVDVANRDFRIDNENLIDAGITI